MFRTKYKKVLFVTFLSGAVLMPIRGFAMVPVVDAGAIANMIKQLAALKQQYQQMRQSYDMARNQWNTAKGIQNIIHDTSSGHYGIGQFMNSDSDIKNLQWSPSSWQSALQSASGGNSARYNQLADAYKQQHPSLTEDNYAKYANNAQAKRYVNQVQTNRAASANATYVFNDINNRIQSVAKILKKIEDDKLNPNTKSAIDLNSRLLGELAYIQLEELKMQSLLNQQMVARSENEVDEQTELANFKLQKPS